jgi:hypothetical protein
VCICYKYRYYYKQFTITDEVNHNNGDMYLCTGASTTYDV